MSGGADKGLRRVVVLINRRSGLDWSFDAMRRAFDQWWDLEGTDLKYQFSQSAADGTAKARRCVEEGVDIVLAVGGDGTISTVGRALIDTPVVLGALPVGSGNGFARHFGIPLSPERAVEALSRGAEKAIDVGVVNGTPFLITCSMAWDASIVQSFERFPVRGVLPYILAGVQEFLQYHAREIHVEFESGETARFADPLVFTVANLTQYGGGARIAPQARPDDGRLELVVALRKDAPKLIANIGRLFDGSIGKLPEVEYRPFRSLRVHREQTGPIQIDGELSEAPAVIEVGVKPGALRILVPEERSHS